MNRTLCSTLLIAAAALAGCDQSNKTNGANEAAANAANTAAPVELPPSIVATKIYRCKDNSVVYVDWLSDGKSANFRAEKNGPAVHVVAPAAGEKMAAADGTALTGSATGGPVTLERPGAGSQVCKG